MAELFEMHVIAKGKVQGVFFRATTKKHADQLGLFGSVKNLSDGSVEIIAQGPKEKLEELLRLLKVDAHPASVYEFDLHYRPIHQKKESFLILR
ncbi:acylphosphatase [Criblamydia sequanensis]|uniref:acylphosphatase n=1 Tax=Candidatus Criblamydia sequanensis CRIB-18 TaxID=1437425 RepID=A0A090D2K0_9BACT|nr:acylphosphatase [Criblamydia sequanensis]CDR34433.1 Acylphosphatase [Criblamydia sequanensis CRIB-18]